jgi:THO complex subunit 5
MAIDSLVTDPSITATLQTSEQSRDQALSLIDLVQASDGTNKAEVAKQQAHLLASIAHLRGLHRHITLAARDTKGATAESRQEVDRLHLQLQNLYYEQRHLQNEIAACEGYE